MLIFPSYGNNPMSLVKLVLLGAPRVGKTSIVRQFSYCEFDEHYSATAEKEVYYPSIVLNDKLYEIRIIDLPPIQKFPSDSFEEWNSSYRDCGLRTASAYILVFDVTSVESFRFISTLREQIKESAAALHANAHQKSSGSAPPIIVVANKQDLLDKTGIHEQRKEFGTVVRKVWKAPYVECSAARNWHINGIFKEVMKQIDIMHSNGKHHHHHHHSVGGTQSRAFPRSRSGCVIQ